MSNAGLSRRAAARAIVNVSYATNAVTEHAGGQIRIG
jgi:hypothetical protein